MTEYRADLHCHTTCSDGTVAPEEIIKMAADSGLSGLSITDHDTIEAYTTAVPFAKQLGVELISGVEFSSMQEDNSVHILAYSFPLDSLIIKDFCVRHHQRRTHRNREILKKLSAHGMPITEEDVTDTISDHLHEHSTIGRPHIALAMLKKGYIHSIQEGFNKYLGEGKLCYAPGESFSVQETINIIHQAKGLAVIAHPHLIDHAATLKQLLEMNFDGIECYYACFSKEKQKRWLKIAEHRQWLITGGSDYHGAIKPNIPLGASWVNEELFRILQKHFQEVSNH
jgi:predicted metal-dependent phosphoesterase TrpH